MLSLMRKYATSWLIKILLGTIVFVFVLWGVGSFRSKREGRVAVVNGETISLEEYKMAYNAILDRMRQQFGNSLNDELIKMFQVKQQALNQIIEKRLLLREAERLNLRVTDAEIARSITRFGAFQINGNFDQKRYQNVLSLNRMTPEGFEALQKETLVIDKLRGFIEASVSISDAEAEEWYNWQNVSVDLDYVFFDPAAYTDIDIQDDDIVSFYEKNKESYKTEPKVKVQYLAFKPSAYEKHVTVAEQQLKDYYEANPEVFVTPKTVEARHILFKVDQNADAETVEAARLKALDVLSRARADEDFATLAKEYSEGPSRDAGGYLGKFKREDMVKPFADKAFSMKAGEVSDPLRTQFGWHIIKVEAVNEKVTPSFDEAKEKIRKKLVDERAKLLAYDAAEAAYNASYEGDNLSETASAQDLVMQTTGLFARQEFNDSLVKNKNQFAEAAFNLSLKEISEVLDFDDGYYIMQVVEKVPEKISELKDVKERLVADLKKEKQKDMADKAAEKIFAELKNKALLEDISRKYNLKVEQTGYFKRNDSIPKIGYDRNILTAAFEISEKKKLSEKVISGEKGFYIIRLKSRKNPDPQSFDKEKSRIKDTLLQQKKRNAFSAWTERLREKSDIMIADGYKE